MIPSVAPLIRQELDGTEGLTISEIAALTGKHRETVRKALMAMPDAYIDRWVPNEKRGPQYVAVWMVVEVPEDCPHPIGERSAAC